MDPVIRAAYSDDAETIAAIFVRTSQAAYRGVLPDAHLDQLSVSDRAVEIARFIATPPPRWRMWIARADGVTIGFCHSRPSVDQDASAAIGEVDSLYVEVAYQGRGFGRRLLEHAVRDLRSEGCSDVTLWTTELNARAREFYEHLDWRPDGTMRVETLGGKEVREVRYRLRHLQAPVLGSDPGTRHECL